MNEGDGYDRLERFGERQAGDFADRPMMTAVRWGLAVLGVVVVLGFVAQLVGFISLWGGEARRIVGPENVRAQYTAVIDDWNAMKAQAGNACDAGKTQSGPNGPTFLEDPAYAVRAQYRSIQRDYDRRMANLFEAKIVRDNLPGDLSRYPREAPTLRQMMRRVC